MALYLGIWSVSPRSVVFEISEKIRVMVILANSGFDMGYIAYCSIHDLVWPQCTSAWLRYIFNTGKVIDILSGSGSCTHCRNADGKPISE